MRKWIKRILVSLFLLVVILAATAYFILRSSIPEYDGEIAGLCDTQVSVYFDDFGVPHIVADNNTDLYRAFGYVHAQERLFQMELMRRVGSGRLAEILGPDLVETDKLFRTIIDPQGVKQAVIHLSQPEFEKENAEVRAYLEGVNHFIANGSTPPEFLLQGIEKNPFTEEDLYYIASYMAFGFALGQRTDPLADRINDEWGPQYLADLSLHNDSNDHFIPSFDSTDYVFLSGLVGQTLDRLPVPVLSGSNSWVVSGLMTNSGKPLLCNDTHISYSVPQSWYEAHLRSPEIDIYGNFLGGIPYALVGHTPELAWGVTMLEHDDMDFFHEQFDEEGAKYLSNDIWWEAHTREESIAVSGGDSIHLEVRSTHHGPIVTDLFEFQDNKPVSMWWDYTKYPNLLLTAFRGLNNASDIEDAESSASLIHGPGLNLTAADVSGNIGWWSCAKFLKRPAHVNSKLILDGTGADEPLGAYPFSSNPKSVNPPWGFVYSANDQPAPLDSIIYPGYYKPSHRADRIKTLLPTRNDWTVEAMKSVMRDVKSPVDSACAALLIAHAGEQHSSEADELRGWTGTHEIDEVAPTIYYTLLYYSLQLALQDEIGEEGLDAFLWTHWMKRAYAPLIANEQTDWWDDVTTPDKESRGEILSRAWDLAIAALETTHGNDREQWSWGNAHTLELEHPFGQVGALRPFFNIAEQPTRGGHETVNQAGFRLNGEGKFRTKIGSQMRIIIDMADVENSVSVAPSGQSGHFMSQHYDDQAEMHRLGLFRPQLRSEAVIEALESRLVFTPVE